MEKERVAASPAMPTLKVNLRTNQTTETKIVDKELTVTQTLALEQDEVRGVTQFGVVDDMDSIVALVRQETVIEQAQPIFEEMKTDHHLIAIDCFIGN